jgi:hypothetical protein
VILILSEDRKKIIMIISMLDGLSFLMRLLKAWALEK